MECIDGSTFTLSEALKDHELVLINLFFTGCPPCRMEFPFLQEAWEQNSDRVAVIALSPDPTDSDAALTAYARELGLGFPIAREDGTGLYERYVTVGFPTSMLIDRSGKVAMVDCGACVRACPMDIRSVGDSECVQCGSCIDLCPDGIVTYNRSGALSYETLLELVAEARGQT